MRVIGTDKIVEFIRRHADSKKWLEAWLAEVRCCQWQCPNDIKERFNSVSILDSNRAIFNIKGNNYRMEIQISFKNKVIIIKRLGTHAEYDRWDT